MPSRLAYCKGKYSTDQPNEEEYAKAQIPVKIEQTPGQKQQGQGIGKQMSPIGMYQWRCENTRDAFDFPGIYSPCNEIPVHETFHCAQYIQNEKN